jgi:hypothetical protein
MTVCECVTLILLWTCYRLQSPFVFCVLQRTCDKDYQANVQS